MCFQRTVLYFLFTPVPRANELKCPPRKTWNLKGKRCWVRLMRRHFPIVAWDKHLSRGKQMTRLREALLSWDYVRGRQPPNSTVSSVEWFFQSSLTNLSHSAQMPSALPDLAKTLCPHSTYWTWCCYLFSMPISPILDQNLIFQSHWKKGQEHISLVLKSPVLKLSWSQTSMSLLTFS